MRELTKDERDKLMYTPQFLICPQIVPVGVLHRLAKAGVMTTREVHKHIVNGTLQTLPGIGPAWERKIIHWYTKPVP